MLVPNLCHDMVPDDRVSKDTMEGERDSVARVCSKVIDVLHSTTTYRWLADYQRAPNCESILIDIDLMKGPNCCITGYTPLFDIIARCRSPSSKVVNLAKGMQTFNVQALRAPTSSSPSHGSLHRAAKAEEHISERMFFHHSLKRT